MSSAPDPLVLLANRAPVRPTATGWASASGGLATALLPVLEARGGAWVAMREPNEKAPLEQAVPEDSPRFTVLRVPLEADEFEDYYLGMANRVLWPLAHYLVAHVEPDRAFWHAYRNVNRRFADAAIAAAGPGSPIWVHDYHLMLTPELIRAARPDARIGYFWHIPWPASEVFRIVPSARALMRGMLGSDLVGFHTMGDAENFCESARDLLGATLVQRADGKGCDVAWQGRRIRVEPHPIGIDVELFEGLGTDPNVIREAAAVRKEAGVERLIIGVDRLDYTKGLLLRLEAFERFLDNYPDWHQRVSLFQVCTPTRTGIPAYDRLRRSVDEAVGRINGRFSEGAWVPVRYRYRTYAQEELAALYLASDVALVTPLRDGMNLVAHEYAATSRLDRPGVLVLSELTGAADYLDGAALVNPYDADGLVRTLRSALDLPDDERRARLTRMKKAVAELDVHLWATHYLEALDAPGDPLPDDYEPEGADETVGVE